VHERSRKDAFNLAKEEMIGLDRKVQIKIEVFNELLFELWEIGYCDLGRNIAMLEKFQGDIGKVISYYIERGFSKK
jgi:hypothetical protein